MKRESTPRLSRFVDDAARDRHRAVHDLALAGLPGHAIEHVTTDFGTVQALRIGDRPGTPVVLLHGMSCTSAMWGPNLVALAEHRPVIALDTIIDCGGSEQTAPVTGRADLVASITQTLDGLGVERAHFVGLSFGAWLAAACAMEVPERVTSVSLLEPAGTLHSIKLGYLAGLLKSFVRKSPRRWDFLFHREPSGDLIALLDASRGFRPVPILPKVLSDDELRSIRAPMQVIIGRQSTTCDAGRTSSRLSPLPRDVTLHIVEDAGHIVSVDQPETVNQLLTAFLAEQGEGSEG